ncbi:MAG TPA: 50S ribosomal protein L31e [Candidatus Acidoferrales bacterium]|nr:50S ribosomal protein L31e [Candidatus Acidoferrales bacterium]
MSKPEPEEEIAAEPAEEEINETTEATAETEQATPAEEETETEEPEAPEAPAAAETEEPAEGEEEIEVVEEKVYTISLRHAWVVTPRGKRAPRAVRDVRNYVARHMKSDEVAISNEINSQIWGRSINKPPRKVTVRAVKDKEGKVIVYPAKGA